MAKLRVGVIFGGRSGEHDVSLVSARAVIEALDRSKYVIVPIGITRQGQWLTLQGHGLSGAPRASLLPARVMAEGAPLALSPQPPPTARRAAAPSLDVVLPILHGTFGEDGTIQGFLELAGIPYAGSGVLGSAAAMDKDVMKRLFLQAGLATAPYQLVRRSQWEADPKAVLRKLARALPFPVFVKPANLGSSVGISKAHDRRELEAAITLAAGYDQKIIVEQGLDARELEVAVLGNEDPQASVVGEIIPAGEFYDYDAKYNNQDSRAVIPARLGVAQARAVRAAAVRAFQACDCEGLARVDFFLEKNTGKLWVNEINSMPGFTSISMYPKLWEASGVPFAKLLDRLIELALERAAQRARLRREK